LNDQNGGRRWRGAGVWDLDFWSFEFVSDFDIRISDLSLLISLSTSIAVGFRALEALIQVIADSRVAIKSKSIAIHFHLGLI